MLYLRTEWPTQNQKDKKVQADRRHQGKETTITVKDGIMLFGRYNYRMVQSCT